MPATKREYQRLPGVGLRRSGFLTAFATRSRLWLGSDHLLRVDSSGFAEEYKRFYFRDIQAFTIRKTRRAIIWNLVLGVLAVPFLLFALLAANDSEPAAAIWFGIVAGIVLIFLGYNLVRGPSVVCHLRTAVQIEELPSLGRLRRTRKFLDRIRPLIAAAQGELSRDQLESATEPPIGVESGYPTAVPSAVTFASPVIKHDTGAFHIALSWLLIADVPSTICSELFRATGWSSLNLLLLGATILVAVASAIRQRRTDLPGKLRMIPWITLGTSLLYFFGSIAYGVFTAMQNGGQHTRAAMHSNPVFLSIEVVSTLTNVILGVAGLWFVREFRRAHVAAPSPIEAPPLVQV